VQVTVATTPAELDAIAGCWDAMSVASPHASRPLYTLVQHAAHTDAAPHVLLFEAAGREPMLVVGRVERRPLQVRAGYRTLARVPARWLVVVAGGVIGATTAEDHGLVLRTLRRQMRGRADILQLSKVEIDSPLHYSARVNLPWFQRGHRPAPQKHHRSDLSSGFDAFLAARSKGTRWRMRKRLRRLDDPEAKMEVRRIGPDDDAAEACRLLDGIAATSYQRGIGVGFADDPLHRALMGWAVSGGPYRAWVLYLDGRPVAYLNGVPHDGTFHLFETAFDPSVAAEDPGSILLARVLQELASEPGIRGFDYGYGDAQYKQTLSDESWDEIDILGFAVRPRGLTLNSLNTAAAFGVSTAKRVLGQERVAALRRHKRTELAVGAGTTVRDD
jgi:CelD/BcsL family acetyltransferase involved in cellulose biosynthesis